MEYGALDFPAEIASVGFLWARKNARDRQIAGVPLLLEQLARSL
jgi:hypothetical protein